MIQIASSCDLVTAYPQIHEVDCDVIEVVGAYAYLWCCCRRGVTRVSLSPTTTICQPRIVEVLEGTAAADRQQGQVNSDVQPSVRSEVQVSAQSEAQAGSQSAVQVEGQPEVQAGAQADSQLSQSLPESHSVAELQSLVDSQTQLETQLYAGSHIQICEMSFELTKLLKRSQVIAFSLVAFSEDGCAKEGVLNC